MLLRGIVSGFAALLLVAVWCIAGSGAALAHGVPGAQAEAGLDPGRDPYTFPNVQLCCERKPPRRDDCCDGYHPPKPQPTFIPVDCSGPTRRDAVGSVREAVARVRNGGTIQILPGAACDISGLLIDKSVSIEAVSYQYGGRAVLSSNWACATASTSPASGGVRIRGFDIEGCLALNSGELLIEETNIAWRGQGAAIEMRGGALAIVHSTVRARETALNAPNGLKVNITNSRFATTPDGRNVIRLNVGRAQISDVLVKGARVGIYVDNVNDGFDIERFDVLRSEGDDPYPAMDQGDQGIVIGDGRVLHDIPWLSGMESRRAGIRSGKIIGYRTGVALGTSTSTEIAGVTVGGAVTGFAIGQGAFVHLVGNTVEKSSGTGISLETGARGSAEKNTVRCARGHCVCYGGDCTGRSNYVFGNGAFRMTDTDCDD